MDETHMWDHPRTLRDTVSGSSGDELSRMRPRLHPQHTLVEVDTIIWVTGAHLDTLPAPEPPHVPVKVVYRIMLSVNTIN